MSNVDVGNSKLVLSPIYTPLKRDEDTVEFRISPWEESTVVISDGQTNGILADVIVSFDGTKQTKDIIDRYDSDLRPELRTLVESLVAKGILIEKDTYGEQDQFAWDYISRNEFVTRTQRAGVTDATVGVVAPKRSACTITSDLEAIGVEMKRFTVDNRDTIRHRSTEGEERVDIGEVVSEFVECDVAIVHNVSHEISFTLNDELYESSTPVLYGAVDGVVGQIGPLVQPGRTSCLECYRQRCRSTMDRPEFFEEFHSSDSQNSTAEFAPMSNVVCGLLELEVTNVLACNTAITQGRMLTLDFRTFGVDVNEILKVPRCNVCDSESTDRPPENVFSPVTDLVNGGEED